jgi:pullulanase/glycogen debranching enzyme
VGVVDADLSNCAYLLNVDGRRMADPWARKMAHVHPSPPVSLVTPTVELMALNDGFKTPAVEDCVILEVHLKDLFGLIGSSIKPNFKNTAEWIRQNGDYFKSLGVNAVELLPCTEYERGEVTEYQWGYMPISAFAPATAYSSDDTGINSITEFQDLVRAFHEVGIAVIMDLVLNHFGSPNSLLEIDQSYYFRTDAQGKLSNWSGCGNDVRAEAPMFGRLVLSSLQHWTAVLGVDGVRLDLAELLGTPLLQEIEEEFRINHPEKILIAEPWSFRGHLARDLDHTTWTCWDDAFREFLPAYVRGHAQSSDLLHQIAACDFRPSARLRYAQSHDDMAWIDRITECPKSDAHNPLPADILRTRMMHLILLTSAGVPMLSAGQDFLLSKRGVSNTWQRADLNSLDARRLKRFHSEHEWVAQLIKFRLSSAGAVLRPREAVSPGWMKVTQLDAEESFVAVLNADGLLGPVKVMIACNPHPFEVQLALPMELHWWPVVVSPRLDCKLAPCPMPKIDHGVLTLPPLGCGLWVVGA